MQIILLDSSEICTYNGFDQCINSYYVSVCTRGSEMYQK